MVTTLFYRFLFSLPLLIGFGLLTRGRQFMQVNQKKTLFFRVLFGFSGICFWFLSVRTMPLGQATALFQSSVIFVTLFSPLLLGERVGIYRWSAVLTGMIGVIVVTDPFSGDLTHYALFGVMAAMSGAVLAILLRRLGLGDAPASVAIWYNLMGFLAISCVLTLFPANFVIYSGTILYQLIALGVVASFLRNSADQFLSICRCCRHLLNAVSADAAVRTCRLFHVRRDYDNDGNHRRSHHYCQLFGDCLARTGPGQGSTALCGG